MTSDEQPSDDAAREAAIRLHHVAGDVEIDNSPETTVSWSEDQSGIAGAYVAAWVYVPIGEIRG